MLHRIRRKLFLSVQMMGGTDNLPNADNSQFGLSDVMGISAKGSSALAR
jgi:SWI/SNF-related matrix-associated actin-dependent regulator of chromatin subfamily A member 5